MAFLDHCDDLLTQCLQTTGGYAQQSDHSAPTPSAGPLISRLQSQVERTQCELRHVSPLPPRLPAFVSSSYLGTTVVFMTSWQRQHIGHCANDDRVVSVTRSTQQRVAIRQNVDFNCRCFHSAIVTKSPSRRKPGRFPTAAACGGFTM